MAEFIVRTLSGSRASYGATGAADLGRMLQLSDRGGEVMIADGFARNTPDASLNAIPGVDMQHLDGYNVARLGGSVSYYLDSRRRIVQLVMPIGWVGAATYATLEQKVWLGMLTQGPN